MIALSQHVTLEEMTLSQTAARLGIANDPPAEILERLRFTCAQMEAVRSLLAQPVTVSSGYRSAKLNLADGGTMKSAHIQGYAIDFICPAFGTPLEVARAVGASAVGFDQLIREYGWVHISFDPQRRRQLLTKTSRMSPYSEGLS
jgi:uncharacterized protein YcbK (DUF882 family)